MTSYGTSLTAAPAEIATDGRKIRKNRFLEEIYRDFYARILAAIPPGSSRASSS